MSNFSGLIPLALIIGGTLLFLSGLKFLLRILKDKSGSGSEVFGKEDDAFPYTKKDVMTASELKLYERLVSAFPDYLVLSQVQLSRAIEAPPSEKSLKWFRTISQMSLDFVLCDTSSNPVCVIELDDKTHLRAEAIKRDAKKDKALGAAGIPIVRIKVDAIPTVTQLPKLLGIIA